MKTWIYFLFHFFSGTNPLLDSPNPEKVFGGFEIFSLLLHIFAYARIHFQKKKLMVGPQTRHIFLKILSLADIEKTSIATFALYFLNVVFFDGKI